MITSRHFIVVFTFVFLVLCVWMATNYRPMTFRGRVDEVTVSNLVIQEINKRYRSVTYDSDEGNWKNHRGGVHKTIGDRGEECLLFKDPVPGEQNIIFLETKCAALGVKEHEVFLNPRQACAMESAAITNPNASVYMLHACEVDRKTILESPEYLRQLFTYPNVHVTELQWERHFDNTPLDEWAKEKMLYHSQYPTEHISDVLRYVMMWKYGGTYLDHDVVLIRSLSGLSNFAGAESLKDVAAGVLNFAHEGVGHDMAAACLEDLRTNFRGDDWGHNGPGVITRVLKQVCGVRQIQDMTPEQCRGFTVYPPSTFYPIPWRQWKLYFDETNADKTLSKLNESLAIHVWNKHSVMEKITVGSRQPYAQIAQKFCPKVYSHSGKHF